MKTQTSRALHNAIMEAGGKDHLPMLAPSNYYKWITTTVPATPKSPDDEGGSQPRTNRVKETYKTISANIHNQLDVEAEGVQIILTGIDNISTLESMLVLMLWRCRRLLKAATRNRGKVIVNTPPPTYEPKSKMVANDDEMSKEKEIDKLMALISMLFKKIYKTTNNNLRTSSNTRNANVENSSRTNEGV
ncbi:hypothetical protein Tco_0298296 [Tanacetum coccineum]